MLSGSFRLLCNGFGRSTRGALCRPPRKDNGRALLGGFLVAQCRHNADVHAKLSPDIRPWLTLHRSKSVGTSNMKAVEGSLGDPGHRGS